jgi:hypothetical protein
MDVFNTFLLMKRFILVTEMAISVPVNGNFTRPKGDTLPMARACAVTVFAKNREKAPRSLIPRIAVDEKNQAGLLAFPGRRVFPLLYNRAVTCI